MGLFTGFSIISGIEVIYFAIKVFFKTLSKPHFDLFQKQEVSKRHISGLDVIFFATKVLFGAAMVNRKKNACANNKPIENT